MSDEQGRHTNECDICRGKGYIMKVVKMVKGERKTDHTICPVCKGRGFVVEDLDT